MKQLSFKPRFELGEPAADCRNLYTGVVREAAERLPSSAIARITDIESRPRRRAYHAPYQHALALRSYRRQREAEFVRREDYRAGKLLGFSLARPARRKLRLQFCSSAAERTSQRGVCKREGFNLNGQAITLDYSPAHTDSDISITFAAADIVHVADTFWNGVYPFIDYSTGGSIDGMIAASDANLGCDDRQDHHHPRTRTAHQQ